MNNPNHQVALMYHSIIASANDVPPDREPGAHLYDLPLENFSQQLDFLMNEGYRVTTIDNIINEETVKNIILTFDDGEMNNYTRAWPIIKKYKFPAYFFVTANRIGKNGYMSWKELDELCYAGIEIGSHGLNHEILTQLSEDQLKKELADSKAILEQHLKIRVDYFSVPRGFLNQKIIEIAQESEYKNIFISGELEEPNPFCIGRLAVKGNWSLDRYKKALEGQVPVGETAFDSLKNLVKGVLGEKGYEKVRGRVLRKKD